MGAFEIFMLILSAISAGAQIWSQQEANQQNIELSNQNREDQQEYATQAAKEANKTTISQYGQLYSPEARVEQLKRAGLSVGLMYGNGGTGSVGTSAAQAATPANAAPYINPLLSSTMFNPMEMLKTARDAENTKMNTQKQGEEIKNLAKVREQIDSSIKQTDANIKLIEEKCNTEVVTQAWTKAKTEQTNLENKLAEQTMDDQIATVHQILNNLQQTYEKGIEEINGMKIDNTNKQELYDLQKKKFNAEIANFNANTMLQIAQKATEEGKQALMKLQEQTEIAKAQGEWGKVASMKKEREVMEYQIDQIAAWTKALENQAEFTETQNQWYAVNSTCNNIGDLLGGIGKIFGATK